MPRPDLGIQTLSTIETIVHLTPSEEQPQKHSAFLSTSRKSHGATSDPSIPANHYANLNATRKNGPKVNSTQAIKSHTRVIHRSRLNHTAVSGHPEKVNRTPAQRLKCAPKSGRSLIHTATRLGPAKRVRKETVHLIKGLGVKMPPRTGGCQNILPCRQMMQANPMF